MGNENTAKLAVLIDADNAQASIVEHVLAEVAKYGTAHVRRAYGDWTGTALKGWKAQLLEHSIQPMQQFAYTTGKNATAAAMLIDAMDLLYTGRFDGFCLVSSDSDFTRLASRIRESGLTVYGFGERKTPRAFVVACDKFIHTENLAGAAYAVVPDRPVTAGELDEATAELLHSVMEAASGDDGWTHLGEFGNQIRKRRPDFDPRTFGFQKLMPLLEANGEFEVVKVDPGEGNPPIAYARSLRG